MFNDFDELKYLLIPEINFEEEFSEITTESKSNINDFYCENDESEEKEYESDNDDSKFRGNILFNNNRNQKLNSTREKNYKDYHILQKINDRDDKQRNTIIPCQEDNFLCQNLNHNY